MNSWLAILIGFLLTSPLDGGEDRAAQKLVEQWRQTLRETKQIAVKFRIHRQNFVFATEEYRDGEYFRSRDCWMMRFMPRHAVPISALEPENVQRIRLKLIDPRRPMLIFSTPDLLIIGDGDEMEQFSWPPASALSSENIPTLGILERLSRSISSAYAHYEMPLYFVCTEDSYSYHVSHSQKKGYFCLHLIRKPRSETFGSFERVEAVFRPEECLPFAIRTIDNSKSVESRYYFDRIDRNEDAQIPDNVLQCWKGSMNRSQSTTC